MFLEFLLHMSASHCEYIYFSFFHFSSFFLLFFVSLVFSDDNEKQPLRFVLSERIFAPTKVSDYIRCDLKQRELICQVLEKRLEFFCVSRQIKSALKPLTEFLLFAWRTEDAAHRIVHVSS